MQIYFISNSKKKLRKVSFSPTVQHVETVTQDESPVERSPDVAAITNKFLQKTSSFFESVVQDMKMLKETVEEGLKDSDDETSAHGPSEDKRRLRSASAPVSEKEKQTLSRHPDDISQAEKVMLQDYEMQLAMALSLSLEEQKKEEEKKTLQEEIDSQPGPSSPARYGQSRAS